MAYCTIFSALITVGPHITLMLPAILSDPEPGMLRDGWRGIRDSLNTGRVFSGSILIGMDTGRASVTVSNFLNNTIVARAAGGRKDSRATPLLHPAPKYANQVLLKWPPLKSRSLLQSASLNHNSNSLLLSTNNSLNSASRSSNHNSSTLL